MPKNIVSAKNIPKKKTDGYKHRTKREIESRLREEGRLQRETPAKLTPPAWLNRDALAVWNKKIREADSLPEADLLDVLDEEYLATYCIVVVNMRDLEGKSKKDIQDHKMINTYAKTLTSLADRLAFNPAARARLARKRSNGNDDDAFGKNFD